MKLRDLANVAIIFVIAGIALGIGAEVLDDLSQGVSNPSIAQRAVQNTSEGIEELASWLPTIGLVIAAALVIGIIFASFGGKV